MSKTKNYHILFFNSTSDNKLFFTLNNQVIRVIDDMSGYPIKILNGYVYTHSIDNRSSYSKDNHFLYGVNAKKEVVKQYKSTYTQHHDFYLKESGVMVLCCDYTEELADDVIVEIDENGNETVLWRSSDWIDYFDTKGYIREYMKRRKVENVSDPIMNIQDSGDKPFDWLHCNSISPIPKNDWNDERFKEGNILVSSRQLSTVFVIDKDTGKIVWDIGSHNFLKSDFQLIGQHDAKMLSNGNILLVDNGGYAGYGYTPEGKIGINVYRRDFTRILEINPITFEIIWEFSANDLGLTLDKYNLYSPYMSNVERLDNGNTLFFLSCSFEVYEVTPDKEVVEKINLKSITNYDFPFYRLGVISIQEYAEFIKNR